MGFPAKLSQTWNTANNLFRYCSCWNDMSCVINTCFCICENKGADQLRRSPPLFSLHEKVQFFCFLNPKFQASSHLLWLYSSLCVGTGWKPWRQISSKCSSYGQFGKKWKVCKLQVLNCKLQVTATFQRLTFGSQLSTRCLQLMYNKPDESLHYTK